MDTPVANTFITLIALLHVYILVLEMFLWEKPIGLRAFRNTPEKAALTKILAANQGLYNGFLAAGLFWGLWLGSTGMQVKFFFLICIIIAGIFGALTATKKIFYLQAMPALIAITCLFYKA